MTRGLMIAAPRSGSGKTTLTLGLLRALRRSGRSVVGVKSGPDYIDPAFHAAASGAPSVNLDSWAMPRELVETLAGEAASGRELMLCEASMGLFDGVPGEPGRTGASADVAAALGLPVLLMIDVSGQAQSAAAVVKGCMSYDPRIEVVGVVLNRVGSARHRRLAGEAIEALGVEVVGSIPRLDALALPERHLGLVQAGEFEALDQRLDEIADAVATHVDLSAIEALARPLKLTPSERALPPHWLRLDSASRWRATPRSRFSIRILLSGWRAAGAELRFFSPLADEPPPEDCDVCWLPGGYPELHAGRLAGAARFREGLRRFARRGPCMANAGAIWRSAPR